MLLSVPRKKPVVNVLSTQSDRLTSDRLFIVLFQWCGHEKISTSSSHLKVIMPLPIMGRGIKRCFCLTSAWRLSDIWCLSHTSGLTREQRGQGRLKLQQRYRTSHVTRTPLSRSKCQRSRSRSPGCYGWLFKSLHTLYGRHHNHNQSEPLPVDNEYSWHAERCRHKACMDWSCATVCGIQGWGHVMRPRAQLVKRCWAIKCR